MGEVYDKYERDGDVHWQWYAANKNGYRQLVTEALAPFHNTSRGTLVDIGCGDGLPLSILDQLGFDCNGVDDNEFGIKLALEHNVNAEFFIQNAERFAGRNLQFDYLFSLNTIEHLLDPKCMVSVMKNIKEFGVIVTDNKDVVGERSSVYHSHEFNPDEFEELFADFDLERLPISDPDYFGYIVRRRDE